MYLFIYFWLRWVFVAARRLSLVALSGGYSFLRCTGSMHVGFSSCGTRAAPGMWDLPGPGIEPMSPVLAGGFLTNVPRGKS